MIDLSSISPVMLRSICFNGYSTTVVIYNRVLLYAGNSTYTGLHVGTDK